jgi:predicted RNA methylase
MRVFYLNKRKINMELEIVKVVKSKITDNQYKKINNLFSIIEKLESSDSSSMTPVEVCNRLIDEKFNTEFSYFDICCGKGTFILCVYIKFWENLDIDDIDEKNSFIINKMCINDVSKSQIDIAIKSLKNLQKILGIKNILTIESYNIDILTYDKNLYNLMKKFDVVITNPPYNSERGDNNQSVDIYPEFVDKAFELADRYVIMITKSNWMNKPSMKDFREKMINKYNVDKIIHYPENPFKGTLISGGVSYFVIDNQNTKETFELNGVVYDRKVALDFLPYELNKNELSVLSKLLKFDKTSLTNFRPKGYYNINTNDVRIKEIGDIECHVSEQKGKLKYLLLDDLDNKMIDDLDKHKIFSTSSYGANPYSLGRLLKGHKQLCSGSLVNWVFDNELEMNNFFEYINTKFFRFCVSLIKNKQDISKNTFSLIPNIDFSKLEKVDDENIYRYLNLTEQDIQTIEERCERLKLLRI